MCLLFLCAVRPGLHCIVRRQHRVEDILSVGRHVCSVSGDGGGEEAGVARSEGRRRVYYVVRMKCGDGVQVSAGEGDLRGVGGMKLKLKGSFRAWWQLRSVAIPPRYVRQTGPAAKTIVTAQIVGQPRSTRTRAPPPASSHSAISTSTLPPCRAFSNLSLKKPQ